MTLDISQIALLLRGLQLLLEDEDTTDDEHDAIIPLEQTLVDEAKRQADAFTAGQR